MFIYQQNSEQKELLGRLFKKVKIIYGNIPPHMELLGNIEADYLEDFLKMILKISRHESINPDMFTFVRLHVAYKEEYDYCMAFNTKMLLSKEYTQDQINDAISDIATIPLDDKHKQLAKYAIKAMYDSKAFTADDFETLYALGWSQRDIFDAIEHAGTLLRNGRILNTYSTKA